MEQFLAYEFRALHLRLVSNCKTHCCKYAVNSAMLPPNIPCPTVHTCQLCTACNQGTLLLNDIEALINYLIAQIDDDNIDMKNDISSMLKAAVLVFRPTIIDYISQQVQVYAQFAKIKEETSQLIDKRCGVWFDHKQKVLPGKHREGQVGYFGKRGMSLIGAMTVQHLTK